MVADIQELSQQGFLATPTIVRLRAPQHSYPAYSTVREMVCPTWRRNPRQLSTLGGKLFAEAYRRGIVYNTARNTQLFRTAWGHVQRGEKVLLLCSALAHGEILFAECTKVLPACWWIHGSESDAVRQRAIEDFQCWGGGALLLASTILDEGIDLPEIDVLILAGAGESSVRTLQRVGRALRPRPDKHEVLIYDVEDGYDLEDPKDYLARHAQQRFADYRSQGFTIL